MARISVFNQMSVDGFIADAGGEMNWAHRRDAEWNEFTASNASSSNSALLFGRVTYQMMESAWTSPEMLRSNPQVAAGMSAMTKIVASRTLTSTNWENTHLISDNFVESVRDLKHGQNKDITILGSASIVAQLTEARLIDAYQVVVVPIVLGAGKSMFAQISNPLGLRLLRSRQFSNGNIVLWYEPSIDP